MTQTIEIVLQFQFKLKSCYRCRISV